MWDRSVPTAQPSGLSAFFVKDARAAAETVATDDLCPRACCRAFALHRVALNFAVVLPCVEQRRHDVPMTVRVGAVASSRWVWAAKKCCVWDRSVLTAQPSGLSAFLWKDARAAAETVATNDLCLRACCRVFELHRVVLSFAVVLPCVKQRRQDVPGP